MANVTKSRINKEYDIGVVFKQAEQAIDSGNYSEAVRLAEMGLNEAKQSNLAMWEQKFDKLHSKAKETHLTTKIRSLLKKAEREEKVYKYENSLTFYTEVKPLLNSLFKLGKNEEKIKKQITKVVGKINELNEKITNDANIKGEGEAEEIYEPKPMKDPSKYKITLNPGTPIVIDGSNVAWNQGDRNGGDKPKLKVLLRVIQALGELGLKNITTFCDFTLPMQIDEKKQLEKLIQEGSIIKRPKGKEADNLILRYAKRKDGYIVVAKEKFRDWYAVFGEEWIKERRIEMDIINTEVFLDPEIEVELLSIKRQEEEDITEELFYQNTKPPEQEPEFIEGVKPSGPPKRIIKKDVEQPEEKPKEIPYNSPVIEKFLIEEGSEKKVPSTPQKSAIQSEKITKNDMAEFIKTISAEVKAQGFHIKELSKKMKKDLKFANNLDVLAIKIVKISESVDVILIVPIKVSNLKGTLIVAEDSLDYNLYNKTMAEIPHNIEKVLLEPNVKEMKKMHKRIFKNIVEEGELFHFFKRYLKRNIVLEKTLKSQKLFLRSGPLQHKILIDPVLCCPGKVHFVEKDTIQFAYQSKTNQHIVEVSNLGGLLEYLETKYDILEHHVKGESALRRYFKAVDKFTKDLKLYSSPFIIFGFLFLCMVVFGVFSALSTFIGIGAAGFGIYGALVAYIVSKFNQEKDQIKEEFHTPYYLQPIPLDETDLNIISEEVEPEIMDQLLYECYGKDADLEILLALESNQEYKDSVRKKKSRRNDRDVNGFKDDTLKGFALKSQNDTLMDKYSSFLED